jgi:diguanylate cyclase (GGDEF)-like protein/PAS domain S-box-containing protein
MFVLSVLAAVVLAWLSLSIRPWLRDRMQKRSLGLLISAVVMGGAISSMHYLAMHATVFIPTFSQQGVVGASMASHTLGFVAVVIAVALLSLSTFAVLMRHRILVAERSNERLEAEAAAIERRLQRVAERVPGVVFQFRLYDDGRFTFPYASEASVEIYGITPEVALEDARRVFERVHPDDRAALRLSIDTSARDLSPWQQEYRVPDNRGGWRWVLGNATPEREEDSVIWSGFVTDVTERRRAEETIRRLAYVDELTGLANRRRILQRLAELVNATPMAGHGHAALIVLDVDRFKRVNDTLGHGAGDALLRTLADRLTALFATSKAEVARLGSDEFAVLRHDLPSEYVSAKQQAVDWATRIQRHLSAPFAIHGTRIEGRVNVGIYLCPELGLAEEEMLRSALIALGHAKRFAEPGLCVFSLDMLEHLREQFQLEHALREALQKGEFALHYQPQVDATGQAVGVEALLRWTHPERGPISPGVFIPLAEDSGLIVPIGAWVLEQACAQLARWSDQPQRGDLSLSVNVSTKQFYGSDFLPKLEALLKVYAFEPSHLVLELTVSLVLADLDDAVDRMTRIRSLGVNFAMDDFGTGYSSLSYLSRLPFDEVKIDQYFIHKCPDGKRRNEWVIVEAIIGIAGTFGMALVAEGVETKEQVAQLRASGCNCFQGFLYARPMPEQALEAWLDKPTADLGAGQP